VFEVDLEAGELRKHGRRIRLPLQSLRVLQVLVERPMQVISRDELRQSLWPADTAAEFDRNLNTAVSRLREALGDAADNPRFVETIPRQGYRFIAPIIDNRKAEPAPPPPALATEPRRTRLFDARHMTALAVILLVVATVALVVGWPSRLSPSRGAGDDKVQTLAVLPFLDLSGDPGQEYFVDGMTEALIVELSSLGGFGVISRTSSMQYKTVTKPVGRIAADLGVDAAVEGSVLRDGNRMRVAVRLIGAPSGAVLWTQSFEREVDTILAFQSEVARRIADAIHVTVGGPRRAAARIDPEVYELYLRGRHLLNRRTEADLQKALEYFEQVIKKDPGNARAHAAIAAAWHAMSDWNNFVAPREGLPRAKAAALRALELDGSLAEAHVRLAFVNETYEWKLPEAEAEYKRAIELDPNLAEAYQHYSLFLSRLGRGEESVQLGQRAYRLDPLSMAVNVEYGTRLLDIGKLDEALAHLQRTVEIDPGYFDTYVHLSHVFEALGRPADQVASALRGAEVSGRAPHALQALARAYAATGNHPEAMKILDELHKRPTQRNAYDVAMIHLRLKQYERGLSWLVKACEERASALAFFYRNQASGLFDPIRQDARFRQVQQCAGVTN
jgi:TolB-like protein/DNA-binding winged helix-turn-helix (wHTH) protein/tetratricopeptide (TPR) repeat protein